MNINTDKPTEAERYRLRLDWKPISPAPTLEEILRVKTPNGAWTKEKLAQWGVPWPPPKGWMKRLLGTETKSTLGVADAAKFRVLLKWFLRMNGEPSFCDVGMTTNAMVCLVAKRLGIEADVDAVIKHLPHREEYDKWRVSQHPPKPSWDPRPFSANSVLNIDFYRSDEWREVRYRALKLHGAKCQCCGRKPPSVTIHVDHIKPRSKYPKLELELSNLQVLCEDCNLGKRAWDETDWRPSCS